MFRLDNLLERWAELYRPLRHDKATHPTFFRIGMIGDNSYFNRNFNTMDGACMAYATHIDAELAQQNPKAISYRHVVYFMQKQPAGTLSKTQITDEEGATEARFQTDAMVQDLIAVLYAMKGCVGGKSLPKYLQAKEAAEIRAFIQQTAADPEYSDGLRGMNLDKAHWGTLPNPNGGTWFNGWHICGLTIEQEVQRQLCVNQERYIMPSDDSSDDDSSYDDSSYDDSSYDDSSDEDDSSSSE